MLKLLSEKEELERRHQAFELLRPGMIFDLAQKRYFIAAEKVGDITWEVVELTRQNRERIVCGQPCERSRLRFAEMNCLNVERG